MREKIIRYEATGRGILSIKDAFYLTSSSSPPVIHLPRSLPPLFPGALPPLRRPRRHVAAASYLVLLKGYFSRPLPLFLHSHRFTKGARNWRAGKNVSRSRDRLSSFAVSLFFFRGDRFSYRPRKTLARVIEKTILSSIESYESLESI